MYSSNSVVKAVNIQQLEKLELIAAIASKMGITCSIHTSMENVLKSLPDQTSRLLITGSVHLVGSYFALRPDLPVWSAKQWIPPVLLLNLYLFLKSFPRETFVCLFTFCDLDAQSLCFVYYNNL